MLRLRVRSSASSPEFPTSRGLPSGRLVSFAAIDGTTPRSATLLRIESGLWFSLDHLPSGDKPEHPAGLLRFPRSLYAHDMVSDPGGPEPARLQRSSLYCLRPLKQPRQPRLPHCVAQYIPCALAVYAWPCPCRFGPKTRYGASG